MPNLPIQVTLDDLLAFIASYTVEHFQKTGRRTDGAVLADAIRRRFPEFSYEQVGLGRLSDAVREAEHRGLVTRHRDVKHLELSPGLNSGLQPGTEVTTHTSAPFPHVSPEIWRAFVFVSRSDVSFLDRSNGRSLSFQDGDPLIASHEADDQYTRISPIPAATQQAWMEEFTRGNQSLDADQAPIQEGEWWLRFSAWLRGVDVGLEREWNRFRTSKVLQYLREWASSNDVPISRLLSPARLARPTGTDRRSERFKAIPALEPERFRDAILAVVREMPLEQLEEIAIPVKYILRHFKPR